MSNKILAVDFINKKVTAGHTGPSDQTFTVLNPPKLNSHKRIIDAIERVDALLVELKSLNEKKED
jgi:hypothetical protein